MILNHYPYKFLLATLLVILSFWLLPAFAQNSAESPGVAAKLFWVERITEDGTLILREYGLSSTQSLNFTDIEVWPKSLGKYDPFFSTYSGTPPDFKLKLLANGYARLRDENSAASEYVKAQNEAKAKGYGMWPKPAPPSASPGASNSASPEHAKTDPAPSPSVEPSSLDGVNRVIGVIQSWNWWNILKGFGALIGIIGLAEIVKLIRAWRRRHKVPLVLVGLPSTGKTWLWESIADAEMSITEKEKIKRTEHTTKKATSKVPMGKYEIVREGIDTPGGQPGEQAASLLDGNRRFQRLRMLFVPQKRVWLIVLATTPDKRVHMGSPWEEKVNPLFVQEQLGYLNLPLGLLGSKVTLKPQMVIICIGKFDLFANAKPTDTSTKSERAQVEAIFKEHVSRISKECQDNGVKVERVVCSAKENWGVNDISRHIQKTLYA